MTLEAVYYIARTIAVIAILGSLVAIFVQQRKDHEPLVWDILPYYRPMDTSGPDEDMQTEIRTHDT